ncbi:hypothetical protein ACET3Z_015727 [Daucus carota]
MQQRIVVRVPMKKEKDRSKAMKIVVGIIGVSSVKIGGEDKDIVIVIGNEVDAVTLTHSLVKKFGSATTLVRVEPFFNRGSGEDDEAAASVMYQGQHKYYGTYYGQPASYYYNPPPQYYPPPPQYYYSYDRPIDDSGCSIM